MSPPAPSSEAPPVDSDNDPLEDPAPVANAMTPLLADPAAVFTFTDPLAP
jgi:hypothetical protein